MAVLSSIHPTLLDITSRMDPDGKIGTIAELLQETNELLDDMVWVEGNLPTGHMSLIRTGLPEPTWRKLYGGVQPSKSETRRVTDTCGMLEAYAEVDKAAADLNGNTAAFRMTETLGHIMGLNNKVSRTVFYGNEGTEPEAFTGFAPRYNSQSAENGDNILTSASTPDSTDNTSIWLVGWGPHTVHGIFPKGSVGGLQATDKGQVTLENVDGNGGRMEAYRYHFRWDCGLTVRDWRYVVRIQIDQEDLTMNAATGPNLISLLSEATELLPTKAGIKPVFYGNRRVMTVLKQQIANKVASSTLTMDSVGGKPVTMFEGIPFKRCDALLNTETGIA